MDIFIEKIVARKRDYKDALISVGAVLLTLILSLIFLTLNTMLMGFGLIVVAGFIYGCYLVITSRNIEFEYSLTNSELDVDRIINRKRRKRLFTVDSKKLDILAPVSHDEFKRYYKNSHSNVKTFECCSSMDADGLYFAVFFDGNGNKNLMVFEPNEKMIAGFKRYNPSKVFEA